MKKSSLLLAAVYAPISNSTAPRSYNLRVHTSTSCTSAANKAIADPKLRQTFINLGMEMSEPMNNEQIQTFLKEDRQYWKDLVQEHKIPMVD